MLCSMIQHCPSMILLLILFALVSHNVLKLAGKHNSVIRQLIHLTLIVLFDFFVGTTLYYLFIFDCIVWFFAQWL